MSDTGPATVAVLANGERGCQGIPRPGHKAPESICRGCLRWTQRNSTTLRIVPVAVAQPGGRYWCQDRIAA